MPTDAHLTRRTSASLAKTLKRLHQRSGVKANAFASEVGFNGDNARQSLIKIFKTANGITYQRLERFEKRLGVPVGIILCLSHTAALIRTARFEKDDQDRKDRAARRLRLMADYLGSLQLMLVGSPQRAPKRRAYEAQSAHDDNAWHEMLDELMEGTRGPGDPCAETEFTGREYRKKPASQPAEIVPAPRKKAQRK